MWSVLPSPISASNLAPQMEPRTGQTLLPQLLWRTVFIIYLNVVWLPALCICAPICLSSCLLLFTFSSLYWQTFIIFHPHNPPLLQRQTHTHKPRRHRHRIIPVSLLYILFRQHCQYPALMRHNAAYVGHALTLCIVWVCFRSAARLPELLPGSCSEYIKKLHNGCTRRGSCSEMDPPDSTS